MNHHIIVLKADNELVHFDPTQPLKLLIFNIKFVEIRFKLLNIVVYVAFKLLIFNMEFVEIQLKFKIIKYCCLCCN
jgi:hypothetical protein